MADDLHKGLLATLDPDHARYVQRSPKAHVRQNVRNGRCSDAHGVEIEAQQKTDGTMSVVVSRLNGRTNERDVIFRMEVPPPGELWGYEQRESTFTEEEREAILSGSLTASPEAVERAEQEQACTDPFFLKGECTNCGQDMAAHAATKAPYLEGKEGASR